MKTLEQRKEQVKKVYVDILKLIQSNEIHPDLAVDMLKNIILYFQENFSEHLESKNAINSDL